MKTNGDAREENMIRLPARNVPLPPTISPQAKAYLIASAAAPLRAPPPPIGDKDKWREYIARSNVETLERFAHLRAADGPKIEEKIIAGVPVYIAVPPGVAPDDPRLFLDFHGGSLVFLAGEGCRQMVSTAALRSGVRTISPDYRVAPDHPYPAALDDCLAVYRALLEDHDPSQIAIGGASAGGNLTAATILRARDEGLPLPAAAVLLTPELDLTESGDSFATLLGLDTILGESLAAPSAVYADGHDLSHPYLSPLFGDFTKGFPPTLVQAGTRDLLLSNAVLVHRALRRAGIRADLHIFEAMPHGGFGGAPEDEDLSREVRAFVAEHLRA